MQKNTIKETCIANSIVLFILIVSFSITLFITDKFGYYIMLAVSFVLLLTHSKKVFLNMSTKYWSRCTCRAVCARPRAPPGRRGVGRSRRWSCRARRKSSRSGGPRRSFAPPPGCGLGPTARRGRRRRAPGVRRRLSGCAGGGNGPLRHADVIGA